MAVVVLRNQYKRNVRIDEKECSNSETLAVTVWPRAWLKPGEEAEVFIAMRPVVKDEHLSVPRPSLLTPNPGRPRHEAKTVVRHPDDCRVVHQRLHPDLQRGLLLTPTIDQR